jgi:hypothetical protein
VNSTTTSAILHSISRQKPITIPLSNGLSVRLYKDTRPNCLETAALQKGLVLMLNDEELIGEGVGFGLPVVKYKDKTYFPGSAKVTVKKQDQSLVLQKTYALDMVSRKRFWKAPYINDGLYSFVQKNFEKTYLKHQNLSPFANKLMELRDTAKIKTEFVKVQSKGNVTVQYVCQPNTISVHVDLSGLVWGGCLEVLILNEQGARFFRKYSDADGLELFDGKIGGWATVVAAGASLSSVKEKVAFSLENIFGALLFRGWENTKNRFSWAGLSYCMRSKREEFDYAIKIKSP